MARQRRRASCCCPRSSHAYVTSCSPAWKCRAATSSASRATATCSSTRKKSRTCAARWRASSRSATSAMRCGSRRRTTAPTMIAEFLLQQFALDAQRPLPRARPGEPGPPVARSTTWSIAPDLKYPPFTPALPAAPDARRPICSRPSASSDVLLHHPFQSFAPVIDFLRAGRRRSAGARDQADAVPHRRRLADRRAPDRRRARRQGSDGGGRAARALRRGGQHRARRTACRKPARTWSTAWSATRRTPRCCWSCAARAGRHAPLLPPRHGQLSPAHRARLHRLRPVHRRTKRSAQDVHEVFMQLTGLTRTPKLRLLLQSPFTLHERAAGELDPRESAQRARGRHGAHHRQDERAGRARRSIEALYEASRAGVQIDLIVRGICACGPACPASRRTSACARSSAASSSTRACSTSTNGGEAELYCASADWMERNFFRRVEVAFPDPGCRRIAARIDAPISTPIWRTTAKRGSWQATARYCTRVAPGGRRRSARRTSCSRATRAGST